MTSTTATPSPASSTATTTQPITTTTTQPSTTTTASLTTTSQTTADSGPNDGHIAASGDITRSAHTFETSPGESAEILIIKGSDDLVFSGTLEGTWKNHYTMELNQSTGAFTMTADIIFTGKVDGKDGTFTGTEVGSGQFFTVSSGKISGHTTIVDGTKELAGLRGVIDGACTFGPESFEGKYTGELYFEG